MELQETDRLRSLGQPVNIKEIKVGIEKPFRVNISLRVKFLLLNSMTYRSQIPFRKKFVEPYIPVMVRWALT